MINKMQLPSVVLTSRRLIVAFFVAAIGMLHLVHVQNHAIKELVQELELMQDRSGDHHVGIELEEPPRWYKIEDEGIGPLHTLEHANKANFSMPGEEEWLLSKPQYNKEDHFEAHDQLIPKYLHKVILTATGEFSDTVAEILNATNGISRPVINSAGSLTAAHLTWRELNPDYEIRYYNLHLCRSYLKQFYHPIILRGFDCIEAFSGKVNFFRYLVVYREGGFYSDWKQVCMIDGLLNWLSSKNTTWFSAFDNPAKSNAMQAGFFGAPPGSPILAEAIDIILRNIQSRADMIEADQQMMTGPGVLGRAFFNVGKRLNWDLPAGIERRAHWNRIPGVRLGEFRYTWGQKFLYNRTLLVVHKCDDCQKNQSWTTGNNYNEKFEMKEYFCPDAPSLFLPTENK